MQKLLRHQEKPPPRLEDRRAELPAGLSEVCSRALAKRPNDRFATPGDLAAALEPFADLAALPAAEAAALRAAARAPEENVEEIDFSFTEVGRAAEAYPASAATVVRPREAAGGERASIPPRSGPPAKQPAPAETIPPGRPVVLDALPADTSHASTAPPTLDPAPKKKSSSRRPRKRRQEPSPAQPQVTRGRGSAVLGGLVLVAAAVAAVSYFGGWWGGRAKTVGEIRTMEGHTDIVYGVAFAPDGRRGVSCGKDRSVRVWDLATGTLEARLEGFSDTVNAVAWSPADDLLLLGGRSPTGRANRSVRLWDVNPGKAVRQFPLPGHTTSVVCVAFSPDGKQALTGGGLRQGGDLALRLWDVARRKEVGQLVGHEDFVFRVAFSPDGTRAASCGNDGSLRLWRLDERTELHSFRDIGGRALCLAFSADGKLLAAGGEDKRIRVWAVSSREETARLEGHAREVFGVAFLPRGRLISTGADKTVRLWDLSEGKETHRFEGHTDIITNLAVSPDGTRALTCGQDRTVRLWGLPRGTDAERVE
jgi:hypothetical protein